GCIYLQVTGTPQSIILQSVLHGWRPDHVLSFQPGEEYVGGSLFFEDVSDNTHTISFSSDSPDEERKNLRVAVITHMVTSAIFKCKEIPVCNMLVHPSHLKEVHKGYLEDIRRTVHEVLSKLDDLDVCMEIQDALTGLKRTYSENVTTEDVIRVLHGM